MLCEKYTGFIWKKFCLDKITGLSIASTTLTLTLEWWAWGNSKRQDLDHPNLKIIPHWSLDWCYELSHIENSAPNFLWSKSFSRANGTLFLTIFTWLLLGMSPDLVHNITCWNLSVKIFKHTKFINFPFFQPLHSCCS